jgi:mono/diheme cytochrome c family protein
MSRKIRSFGIWFTALTTSIFFMSAARIGNAEPKTGVSRLHSAPPVASRMKNPYAGQPEAAKAGAELYAQNCSPCHAANAGGAGPYPALRSGPTQAAPDGAIFWLIGTGNNQKGMPSFRSLTQQQRWQIVTYLKSLGSADAKPERPASPASDPRNKP